LPKPLPIDVLGDIQARNDAVVLRQRLGVGRLWGCMMGMSESSLKIREILSLLTPMRVKDHRKTRIGGATDGGYVMLDSFPNGTVAYSLGIGGDVSWDIDMADRGIEVFQFDHTVDGPPIKHPKFHFNKVGIGPSDTENTQFRRLDTLIRDNKHDSADLILKMDIEDAEWSVIDSIASSTIAKFSQIVVEFHGLARLNQASWQEQIERSLKKLRLSHVPFHVHGNNWGDFSIVCGVPVPDVIEISFANRSRFTFLQNQEIFPTALDHPCKLDVPDYYLGTFQFGLSPDVSDSHSKHG
jgi:hypothetical protein